MRCITCGAVTAVRTSIGHDDYQEFAFPCPKCGIEIRYGMTLDQKTATGDYTKVVNATIESPHAEAVATLTFNSEILIPRYLTGDIATFYSPFIHASSLAKDMLAYKRHFDERLFLVRNVWPVLKNCAVHFENRNWPLYRKEMKVLGEDLDRSNEQELMAHCLRRLHRFSTAFRPDSDGASSIVRQRINRAESINSAHCASLIAYFDGIGWSATLFHEVQSLRDRWTTVYQVIQPIYLVFEWDAKAHKLTDYTIAQKRLDDIKGFYVDGFETLCRLSVLAGAFEGIIAGTGGFVPTQTVDITPDAFRAMTNGKKKDIVSHWAVASVFAPMADNQLRNGIGHHACRYDIKSDNVEYRIENASGITPMTIPYVLFCEKIQQLYNALELAAIYLHWIQARKCGLQGRVV